MKAPAFPRGVGDPKDHQSLATSQWTPADKVRESLAVDGKGNAILLGWLPNENGGQTPVGFDDDSHIVTIAGSRAGKGVSLLLPNLLNYPGSVICVDLKGENAAVTARYREEELGQRVVRLDPFKIVTDNPDGFNPLEFLDDQSPELIDDLTDLAEAFLVRGSAKDAHWDESARAVIKAVLLFIVRTHQKGDRKLSYLRHYLLEGYDADDGDGPSFESLLFAMHSVGDQFLAGMAGRLRDMGDDERGSVISTVQRNTEFLDSESVADTLDHSSFDPAELRDGMTIYLVLPEWRLAGHNRWLRLLITVLLQSLQRNPKRRISDPSVLFVLDEFAALGHMNVIERAAGYIAGFGVKIWTVLQDLAQLKDIYSRRWETFLGNAGLFTAFGNIDLTTLDYISKRLDKCEALRFEQSYSDTTSFQDGQQLAAIGAGGSEGSTFSPKTVVTPLLQPGEVARYFGKQTGNIYIGLGSDVHIWAHRLINYQHEPFRSRGDASPYHG